MGCSTHKGAGVESDTLGSIAVVQIRNPGLGMVPAVKRNQQIQCVFWWMLLTASEE